MKQHLQFSRKLNDSIYIFHCYHYYEAPTQLVRNCKGNLLGGVLCCYLRPTVLKIG